MAINASNPPLTSPNRQTRWFLLLFGLVFGAIALAQTIVMTGAAVVTEVNGAVQVRVGNNPPVTLVAGSRVPAGAVVSTGTDSNSVLTFADGQVIVLGERTLFRIVNYDYEPKELNRSGVFLNLIEGSARLVMGTIGQFDPKLIRIQVGTGTLVGAARPEGGGATDAGVVVEGAATIVSVAQGRVTLTLPTGQGITVDSGQGAYVQPNGTVQQGSLDQIAAQVGQTPTGKQVLDQLDQMQAYVFPQRNQQTIITLATPGSIESTTASGSAGTSQSTAAASTTANASTNGDTSTNADAQPSAPNLPDDPTASIDPPLLASSTTTTAATGAGGGGTPCAASCN